MTRVKKLTSIMMEEFEAQGITVEHIETIRKEYTYYRYYLIQGVRYLKKTENKTLKKVILNTKSF